MLRDLQSAFDGESNGAAASVQDLSNVDVGLGDTDNEFFWQLDHMVVVVVVGGWSVVGGGGVGL